MHGVQGVGVEGGYVEQDCEKQESVDGVRHVAHPEHGQLETDDHRRATTTHNFDTHRTKLKIKKKQEKQ